MPKTQAYLLILALAGCGGEASEPEAGGADYQYPIAAAPVAPAATPPTLLPDHNYDDREGWTYFYIAALSEEARRQGQATGGVSAFQYLGRNPDGQYILASMNDNGTVSYRAKCGEPCTIIDTDYGRKIAYSPDSIIGVAFQDAFRGKLRVADWARDEMRQEAAAQEASMSRPESNSPTVANPVVAPQAAPGITVPVSPPEVGTENGKEAPAAPSAG